MRQSREATRRAELTGNNIGSLVNSVRYGASSRRKINDRSWPKPARHAACGSLALACATLHAIYQVR
jgi:hypothetical protein